MRIARVDTQGEFLAMVYEVAAAALLAPKNHGDSSWCFQLIVVRSERVLPAVVTTGTHYHSFCSGVVSHPVFVNESILRKTGQLTLLGYKTTQVGNQSE